MVNWFFSLIVAVRCMGLIGGVKYELGIAREGVDFVESPRLSFAPGYTNFISKFKR